MVLLQLRLFGGFSAGGQAAHYDDFATDKVRALLAYLAIESHQPHRRSHLSTLLWADWDERSALSNLRKSLFRLRQALDEITTGSAEQLLDTGHNTISLRPELIDVDVLAFQSLLRECAEHAHAELARCPECRARLVQAVELYQGDLLAGLALSGAQPFEEWLTVGQEKYHRQAVDALDQLTEALHAEGDHEAAIRFATRQLALEPWRETAHRQLMRLYAAAGQPALALRQYEKCREVLEEELGVLPAAETEQLLAAIKAGRAEVATASPSSTKALHGFPAQATTFVGREQELQTAVDFLRDPDVRLLTLTGLGGSGKTSLASIAVGQLAAEPGSFNGDAWFIPLAGLTDAGALATTIGGHMNLMFNAASSPESQVIAFLGERPALLVLDNYEQLLPATAFVEQILTGAPATRLVVTSRVPLNLRAEWRLPVAGLPVPDEQTPLAELREYEAVQLLEAIGRQSDPAFRVTEANAAAISHICRRLDGIPLALEIAGNWLHLFPPDVLAAQLDDSLESLVAVRRDMPARHRSLQAVFNHSWSLLSSAEQTALSRLTRFQSSFSLAAARAVAGASLAELTALLDHSLLRRHASGRFTLHPVLREFAAAHVARADDLEREHARWYLQQVAALSNQLTTRDAADAVATMDHNRDDIRLAWQWAVANSHLEWLAGSLDGLAIYYRLKGLYGEGREVFATAARLLSDHGDAPALAGRLKLAAASFSLKLGDREGALALTNEVLAGGDETTQTPAWLFLGHLYEARSEYGAAVDAIEQAMARLEAAGDTAGLADGFDQLGRLHRWQGAYDESITAYEKALALNRQLGNDLRQSENHAGMSLIYKDRSEFDAAIAHLEEALTIARAMNHRENIARFTQNKGLIYWQMDQLDEALVCYQEALAIAEEIQHLRGMSLCLSTIGVMYRRRHEYDKSIQHYERALAIMDRLGDRANAAIATGNLGNVYIDMGQFDRALELATRALAIDRELGAVEGISRDLGYIGDIYKDQGRFAEARPYYEESIPLMRDIRSKYYLAWQLVAYAQVLFGLGLYEESRSQLREGTQLSEEAGRRQDRFDARILEARLAAVTQGNAEALALLSNLSCQYDQPEEQAEIAFVTWELTGEATQRERAVALFSELHAQTGMYRYRQRLERLTE